MLSVPFDKIVLNNLPDTMGKIQKIGKERKDYRGIEIVCNRERQPLYLKAGVSARQKMACAFSNMEVFGKGRADGA